jgi:4-hydroxyphenylpyruvate dioxygenase
MPINFEIDFIEIYSPMAKALAYWHNKALGFSILAVKNAETKSLGVSSYLLESRDARIVLTSSYPPYQDSNHEISSFIAKNYCGVKRVVLKVDEVGEVFEHSVLNGAFPTKFPQRYEDEHGWIEEASIKLYDDSEITFLNRSHYLGVFKPGYKELGASGLQAGSQHITSVDHVASELRINETLFWSNYINRTLSTSLVQSIHKSEDNKTGMILKINRSGDKNLTFVFAEPDGYLGASKVQQNINLFGPGIHHVAFGTDDLKASARDFALNGVEFVHFPPSYYDLLRENEGFKHIDIDELQQLNILCDKEGDTYLLQKFIKPISDRPFFIYELVQRINGYDGFALGNINVLKKAEEIEIMKSK